jgi:hypothetical protein
MEEVRYPYYSRREAAVLDTFEFAKWSLRRIWDVNPHQTRLPSILKRRVIASYARRYKLRTFVESGTYLGETVAYVRKYCHRVYSVEVQPHLAKAARERFAHDSGICIVHGNGADCIARIVGELSEPALFWLDGHFAAGTAREDEVACPTLQELAAALADTRYSHVLLIDDAREFMGKGGYPTLDALQQFIRSARPDVTIEVKNDIVRVARQ